MPVHPRTGSRRAWLALAILSIVALLASACGDDDSADESPGTDEPAEEPAEEPADEPAEEPADEPADEPAEEPADEPADDGAASGELVVAIDRDPERLDPNFARNTAADTVKQAIFDPLIYEEVDGTLVPALATEWDFPDDLTMTMTLRDGVTFHNGDPFTAEDVKWSIERVQDVHGEEGSQIKAQFEAISSVEVVDDTHVELQFSAPDGNILYNLSRLMMVPNGMTTEQVEPSPVGTGPFTFVSFSSGQEAVVEANPDYWEGGPKDPAQVERVVFQVVPEPTTRSAALISGEIDIAMNIPLDQAQLVDSAGRTSLTFSDGRNRVVVINTGQFGPDAASATGAKAEAYEALTDPVVRRALNYAINREEVAEVIYRGIATPLGQPFSPGGFGYDPDIEPYPYDPDQARELLAEAGYPDGFEVTLRADQQTPSDELAVIVSNLEDIGLSVQTETVDPAVANELLLAGDPGMLRYQLWNNPESFLNLMVRSDARPYTAYSDPEVDALFDEQLQTVDPVARQELISQILEILREDPMAIYLWSSVATHGWNPDKVSGFEPHAKGWIPVTGVSVSG